MIPSTQGKATDREVEMLQILKNKLEGSIFKIIGFAFDGDTTYNKLHVDFFSNYYNKIKDNNKFNNFSDINGMPIISDPLHLLKRARYRILSHNVHSGFTNQSSIINTTQIQEILELPTLVWKNEKYTKMQDDLPIKLFSLENLLKLYDKKQFNEISYFLPLCFMNIALSEKELTNEERRNLLEISFYYMMIYYGITTSPIATISERKQGNNIDVKMFPKQFVIQYCNTVASILSVICKYNGTIDLNRIGSNPVEHLFGLVRMKSRYIHTFEKMKKALGKIELHRKMLKDLKLNQPIRKRNSYYGQKIYNKIKTFTDVFEGNPRDVALSLSLKFGFPVTMRDISVWDFTTIFELSDDIFKNFFQALKNLQNRINPTMRYRVRGRDIHTASGRSILERIKDNEIVK